MKERKTEWFMSCEQRQTREGEGREEWAEVSDLFDAGRGAQ